jgi:hypothetical protein
MLKLESELLLRLAVYSQSVHLRAKPLETHDQCTFFFQRNTCGYSPYITSSLTRGWVCRLQLLLALASAIILGSSFTVSNLRVPQSSGPGQRIFIQGTGWPRYTLRHWIPLLSPPTTRRAAVEVFEPTSTRDRLSHSFRFCLYTHNFSCKQGLLPVQPIFWEQTRIIENRIPRVY